MDTSIGSSVSLIVISSANNHILICLVAVCYPRALHLNWLSWCCIWSGVAKLPCDSDLNIMRRLAERRSYRSPPTRLSTGCQRLWLVRSRAQGAFHCPAHLPAGQPLLLPRITTFITGPSKPVWRSVLCIQDVLCAAIAHPVLHLSFDVRYRVLTPRHKIMLNMLLISSAHIRDPLSTPQLRIDDHGKPRLCAPISQVTSPQ